VTTPRCYIEFVCSWGDCPQCGFISSGWGVTPETFRLCPNCGVRGAPINWPPPWANFLLDKAFEMRPRDYQDDAVIGTLVATGLEVMLERVVTGILEHYAGDSEHGQDLSKYVLGIVLGAEERIELIKDLTGVSMKTVARQVGEPDFPKEWKALREARNRFLHQGESCAFEPDQGTRLLLMVEAGARVLAEVHNRVLKGTT
jgi:hypothetical protein